MTPLRRLLVVSASAGLVAVLLAAGTDGPVRVTAALWFVLVCPGIAVAPLLPGARGPAGAIVVGLSLALGTVVATALLVAGAFSAAAGLGALAAVCVAACALELRLAAAARPADHIVLLHAPRPARPGGPADQAPAGEGSPSPGAAGRGRQMRTNS